MIPNNPIKKRLLILTDCFSDLAGGAEKQIYELAKGLDKNKYEVHVASLEFCGQSVHEAVRNTGSQLHIFRVVRIYGLTGLFQGLRFYHFLKSNRIDVLMTYHFSSDIWGTFWGHLASIKTIISNRRDMCFWRKGIHVVAYKLMNQWVDKIVTVSESVKQVITKQEGINPKRIEVIYNGVELPLNHPDNSHSLRRKFGINEDDVVIMHVANLKPVQGHRYLLEAFAWLNRGYAGIKLVLIGRDELNGQVQQLAREMGIADHVLFLGKRSDVTELIPMADICVLPSLSEGLSNAVLEYMAAQKPVVATRVGGNPELIENGVSGLLVDQKDLGQLKNVLLLLIKDQQKRREMGHCAYERVKKEFSIPAMLSRYTGLFSNIRVLHLISSGGLFGAERMLLNLAAKSEGMVNPFVGALNNSHNTHLEIIEEAKDLGLNTVVFDSQGRFDLTAVAHVKEFIRNHQINIVHTHNYKSDIIGFLAAKWAGVKWIATNHGWVKADKKLGFYEEVDSLILKNAHYVVVVSDENRQIFIKNSFKPKKLSRIDNGVPIEKFNYQQPMDPLRELWGIKASDNVVSIVGRLSPEKGHETFLKAAVEITRYRSEVKFLVVGDGPLKDQLRDQVQTQHLSSLVIFTGIRDDMPAIYALTNILVNASYKEGMPMTILEAMAARVPVIATNVGGLKDIIEDGKNGILLKAGDHQQMASAVLDLLGNNEKRLGLAHRAYEEVCRRFSDEQMAKQYNEIYKIALLN